MEDKTQTVKKRSKQNKNNNDDSESDDENVIDMDGPGYYMIHVAYQFSTTAFKIKESTPFVKLMKQFCTTKNLQYGIVRFVYDGIRIQEDDTVSSLGMEDDDIIDALTEQTGGCGYVL